MPAEVAVREVNGEKEKSDRWREGLKSEGEEHGEREEKGRIKDEHLMEEK